jgi:hypothetical protein
MNAKPLDKAVFFLALIALLMLAAIPWIIQESNRPLMPAELAITATEYVFIEQTFQYQRDLERMQATSIIVFDTPTPPFTEAPAISSSEETALMDAKRFELVSWQSNYAQPYATIEPLRAYSPNALGVYYCPSSDAMTDRVVEPYAEFTILGYSENHLGDVYFLIQDDLARGQQWVRFSGSLIFLDNVDYKQVFRVQSSCRLGSNATVIAQMMPTPTPTPSPTPTIELPRAVTATPELISSVLVITNDDATRLLEGFDDEFQDVTAAIDEQGMTITGNTFISIPILGRRPVPFEIKGTLEVREQKLRMNVQTLNVNGIDRSGSEDRERVEYLVNNLLLNLMYGRLVQNITLSEGHLTINVLQHPTLGTDIFTRLTPTATFSPTSAASEMLTPTLPRALTATPAARAAGRENRSSQFPLNDLAASFQLEGLSLGWLNLSIRFQNDGRVNVTASIPVASFLGSTLSAEVSVSSRLRANGGRLELESDAVSVNGAPLNVRIAETQVERLVNSWLSRILSDQFVNSFDIQSGVLRINP